MPGLSSGESSGLGQFTDLVAWLDVQAMGRRAATPAKKRSPFLLSAGFLPLAKSDALTLGADCDEKVLLLRLYLQALY